MYTEYRPNSKNLQQELEHLRARLGERQRALQSGYEGIRFQEYYYEMFEDAMAAAGITCALGEKEDEIKYLLSLAATSVVGIYRLRGTTVSRITYLPDFEDKIFVDDSLTNPWTFVRGVYAALVANEDSALNELLALEPNASEGEHVIVSPLVDKYVSALRQILTGSNETLAKDINEIMTRWANCSEPDDRFWVRQAIVLKHIADWDEACFLKALDDLKVAHESYYSGKGCQHGPECALAIPVRGLKALAMHLGKQVAHT